MKKIVLLCLSLILCVTFSACGKEAEQTQQQAAVPATAVFETSMGTFKCRLDTKNAPLTTKNFIDLSKKGFYNGLTFHRVIDGFMIQGGDPKGNGTGGPGYTIKDEFSPELKHNRPGTLSMANAGPNTGSSQFFVTVVPTPWLQNHHSIFGKVVENYDVVEAISKTATDFRDKPLEDVVIDTIEIVEK